MRRALVVVNPKAGAGRGERVWRRLLTQWPELSRLPVALARDPVVADATLRAALIDRPSRVVVVGGDGTLNRTLNILHRAGALDGLPVGIVPAGSGSDLVRGLALPADPLQAMRNALGGRLRSIDLLSLTAQEVEEALVANIASIGVSGPVAERLNAVGHRWPGAYTAAALGALRRFSAIACRVLLDDRPWFEGRLILAAFANGPVFGHGLRIAPQAQLDDGLMDVVLAQEERYMKLLGAVPRLYRGTHLGLPFVRHARAREVEIIPLEPPPPLEMDGETAPGQRFRIRVLPGALTLGA